MPGRRPRSRSNECRSASFSATTVRLVAGELGEAARRARARSLAERGRAAGIAVARRARRPRHGSQCGAPGACATSLHVLTTSRCSQVENCDSPRNCRMRTTASRATPAPRRARPRGRAAGAAPASRRAARAARTAPSSARCRRPSPASPGSGRTASRRRAADRPAALDRSDGSSGRGGCTRRRTLVRRAASLPTGSGRACAAPTAARSICYAERLRLDAEAAPGDAAARRRSPWPSTRPRAAAGSVASGSTSRARRCSSRSCCDRRAPVARWPS